MLSMFLARLQLFQGVRKGALTIKSPRSQLGKVSREYRRLFSTPPYFWNWHVFCFVLNQKKTHVEDQTTKSIKYRQNLRPEVSKLWPKGHIWSTACFSKPSFIGTHPRPLVSIVSTVLSQYNARVE